MFGKTQKSTEKSSGKYIAVILVIILVFVAFGMIYFLSFDTTNIYDEDGDDYAYYYDYWESVMYTDIIYVDPSVSDGDGETWETAFDEIMEAEEEAGDGVNDLTLIVLSAGVHDVNYNNPSTIKNIAMICAGDQGVGISVIINSNPNTDYIFKFKGKTILCHLTFEIGVSDHDGIILEGEGVAGSILNEVNIGGFSSTGTNIAIFLKDISSVRLVNVRIVGSYIYTTGISVEGVRSFLLEDSLITYCAVGFIGDATSVIYGIANTVFNTCAVGVNISDDSISSTMVNIEFRRCAIQIMNSEGTVIIGIQSDKEYINTYPTTPLNNNTLTSGSSPNEFGAWTLLIPNNTYTRHFQIVGGFVNNASVDTVYMIQASYTINSVRVNTSTILVSGTNEFAIITGSIESPILPKSASIELRISTAEGTSDTIQIWMYIVQF
jgi:hypothetical protein